MSSKNTEAFTKNTDWLSLRDTVVAGNVNSNTIWDRARPLGNQTAVVKILEAGGIVGAYHECYGERQGQGTRQTLFFLKDRQNPFPIDYVFPPNRWGDISPESFDC